MVATKRSASSPVKAAKAARLVCVADAQWQPARELLTASSKGLPASCVKMLSWALPHALCTVETERHGFQDAIINEVALLHVEEARKRRAVVEASEVEVVALTAEKDERLKDHEVAKAEEAEKRFAKDAKAALISTATGGLEAAKSQEDGDRVELGEMQAQSKLANDTKSEYEQKVTSCWPQLKACAFEKKDWRARNKAIDAIIEGCFRKAQVPKSLIVALPPVLKVGSPEERDEFSKTVVEHADMALEEELAKMAARIQELEGAVSEKTAAAERSGEHTKKAQAEVDAAMHVAMEAEKVWKEADDKVIALHTAITNFDFQLQQVLSRMEEEKASLVSFGDLVSNFTTLVNNVPAAPAVTTEAAAEVAKAVPEAEICQ